MNGRSSAPVSVTLSGVPETLLWLLYMRAKWAQGRSAVIRDPMAVELVSRIDYPFAQRFGRALESAALRALRFDDAVRRFLREHPEGTVVSLGEGLGTGFWRVDNDRVRWLSVDLPEVAALRSQCLPVGERNRNLACSALDGRWMDEVDTSRGVLIVAEGLVMYLQQKEVEELIGTCAVRFPGAEMMLDVIPRWLSRKTRSDDGFWVSNDYQVPPMPFGIDSHELPEWLRRIHPNVVHVEQVPLGRGRGFLFGYLLPLLNLLPIRPLTDRLFALDHLRFGSV